MSNSWTRFQQLNGAKHSTTQAKVNNHFIYKGYPSIEIERYVTQGGLIVRETKQAAVVNKQEKNEAYIYTVTSDPLTIGSVWGAKTLKWLIAEEIITIKNVDWHKYHSFLCNVSVNNISGLFIGPEKSHINLNLSKDIVLFSQQKPMLILPGKPLNFQDKIAISGRAWLVDEYDSISTPGITYYSLSTTTISEEVTQAHPTEDVYIEQYSEPVLQLKTDEPGTEIIEIYPNKTITVTTENGYFKSTINTLKISKHTSTQVVFTVPYGIKEFAIECKVNNVLTTSYYKVVE